MPSAADGGTRSFLFGDVVGSCGERMERTQSTPLCAYRAKLDSAMASRNHTPPQQPSAFDAGGGSEGESLRCPSSLLKIKSM